MSTDSGKISTRDMTDVEEKLGPQPANRNLALLVGCSTYAGDPTNNLTPEFIGQFCRDSTNAALYWASTAASSGWKKLTP